VGLDIEEEIADIDGAYSDIATYIKILDWTHLIRLIVFSRLCSIKFASAD